MITNLSLQNANFSYGNHSILNGEQGKPVTPFEQQKEEERLARLGIGEEAKKDKNSPNYECETCKNRKYVDGSDEMVSFKSPAHVSPQASAAAVMGHEMEHVNNAYAKAETGNGKVLQASVTLKTAICPECGRSYVAGGETRTQIKYYNEDNPYQKDLALQDKSKYSGMNVDGKA